MSKDNERKDEEMITKEEAKDLLLDEDATLSSFGIEKK